MTFNKFGKGKIKKMQMSPDSVIQMALQLAFYRDQEQRSDDPRVSGLR